MSVEIRENEFAGDGARMGAQALIVQTMIHLTRDAKLAAPVDLGQLRMSIMWRKGWGSDPFGFPVESGFNEGDGEPAREKIDQPSGLEGYVGTAVDHGVYQEFGTRNMPAQPFMRPAADAVRGATAAGIARRWGPEAMRRAWRARRRRRR